jgi:hypothetical protein
VVRQFPTPHLLNEEVLQCVKRQVDQCEDFRTAEVREETRKETLLSKTGLLWKSAGVVTCCAGEG